MNKYTNIFKKLIMGAILGVFLVFCVFTNAFSVKTKATQVNISPIVSFDDIPIGAKIVFNSTLDYTGFNSVGIYYINADASSYSTYNTQAFTSNNESYGKIQIATGTNKQIYYKSTSGVDSLKVNYGSWNSTLYTTLIVSSNLYIWKSGASSYDNSDSTFLNWFNNNANVYIEQTTPQYAITLNANGGYFEDGNGNTSNTLTFNANEGAINDAITSELGANSLINYGYTFVGWSTSSSDATTLTTAQLNAINTATTLYAVWRSNDAVLIQFDANTTGYSGTPPGSVYFNKNNYYNLPNNPGNMAKPNYEFLGWAPISNGTYNDVVATYYITQATTFYGVWRPVQKTLTLNLNGGNLPGYTTNTFTYDYGTSVNLSAFGTPVKTSFIFLGWGTTANATEYVSTINMTANITLYAIYGTATQDLATITFNGNGNTGGAVPGNVQVVKGTTYTLPNNPGELVKNGYTFIGWGATADATTPLATITPNANITLYAIWSQLAYANIVLKINGETIGTCKIYNSGLPSFYIRFGEFNTDYYQIQITANNGFTIDAINDVWLWAVYYDTGNKKASITYTFNGEHITNIKFTNANGDTTTYDSASIDLMHYSLLVYYSNNNTYTLDIETTPNTEIDNFKTIVGGITGAMQSLLNINVGWFTLGALVSVVIAIGVLFFVFKIARGGGNG